MAASPCQGQAQNHAVVKDKRPAFGYSSFMELIRESESLADACAKLGQAKFITVDTEFIRDTTYWPELCLVQIAGPEDVVLIDPLAKGLKLDPLFELMAAKKVTKVLHAARQDIEIFHHMAGVIPQPLFDTQVAAMVCGFGDSVGYEALVKQIVNAPIDKSSRFTDWRRRPLSPEQLSYAVADVTHLRVVYEVLRQRLTENGREGWLAEEMAVLLDPATYSTSPEDAWKRIKPKSMNRKALAILIEVAAWREKEARNRNVPRARILKDEALLELAAQAPNSRENLASLRAIPSGFANSRAAKPVLDAVARGVIKPKEEIPALPRARVPVHGTGPLVELLKVLLKMKCETHGVAQKLVASTGDLEAIAAEEDPDVPALTGWRREVFGDDALALKRGEIGIALSGGKLVCTKIEGGAAVIQPMPAPRRRRHGQRHG